MNGDIFAVTFQNYSFIRLVFNKRNIDVLITMTMAVKTKGNRNTMNAFLCGHVISKLFHMAREDSGDTNIRKVRRVNLLAGVKLWTPYFL